LLQLPGVRYWKKHTPMKKIIPPKRKAAIALEAVKGVKTANQLGSEYETHPIQIGIWKKQLIENAHLVFSGARKEKESEQAALIDRLYKIIGQRDTELDWLKKNCTLSHEERKALIVPEHPAISLVRQTDFCIAALNRARSMETPEIHNMDNIFTERLWRTVKYENIFLKSYRNIVEARAGLSEYFPFYNTKRRHQSLGYRTPESVYFEKS
jgi:hypothetical protein